MQKSALLGEKRRSESLCHFTVSCDLASLHGICLVREESAKFDNGITAAEEGGEEGKEQPRGQQGMCVGR